VNLIGKFNSTRLLLPRSFLAKSALPMAKNSVPAASPVVSSLTVVISSLAPL